MIKAEHLIKRKYSVSEMDSVRARRKDLRFKGKDPKLLSRCENVWNNLAEFRQRRARSIRYCYGDQWGDIISVNGKQMTYRQYLMNQGNVVIQTNQIKNRVETIVGQMVKESLEPVCHAVDREEQQYGEIMTACVQTNCHKNVFSELKKLWLRELNLGGLSVGYESYDDHSGPDRRMDSWSSFVNPNLFFFESESVDPLARDASLMGRMCYGTFEEICAQFARSPQDYNVLREIYNNQASPDRQEDSGEITERFADGELVFMRHYDPTRCYVCEVWTKETKPRIRLNDLNSGTEEIIDADDKEYRRQVREENRRRRALALQSGFSEDEVPYIIGDGFGSDAEERNGFFMDTFWYCRFLAPDGTILWEGESPYADRGHPFTVCMFPFVDGRINGYMDDAIDMNLAMNRAVVLHDWLLRSGAKGVTVVPRAILGNMTEREFARSWTSIDDMVFIDIDESKKDLFPKVFYGAAQNFDVGSLLATYSRLMESGTPVNAALQGKTPNSGTSGTLYAQMTTNASTPIAALMESFNKFVERILNKKMKNIAMFYTPERYQSIAGSIDGLLNNENLNLNEVGDIEYDLTVKESADTPVFRAVINQDAKEFLLNGMITFEEYLEIADVPYADKILQGRQARQAEMEAAQQQGMPLSGGAPSPGEGQAPVVPGLAPGVRLPQAPVQ